MRSLKKSNFISSLAHSIYEQAYCQLLDFDSIEVSPHFKLSEFFASSKAVSLGVVNIPSKDDFEEVCFNICYLCHFVLEPLRTHFSSPLTINSCFRTPTVNEAVGGVKNSYHLYGRAADVRFNSLPLSVISSYCSSRGIKYIKYNSFIHIQI